MPRRNNNVSYSLEVMTPNGRTIQINNLNTLDKIATKINCNFFNSFDVVSRAMVNNWLFYPNQPRRSFANNFTIKKIKLNVKNENCEL